VRIIRNKCRVSLILKLVALENVELLWLFDIWRKQINFLRCSYAFPPPWPGEQPVRPQGPAHADWDGTLFPFIQHFDTYHCANTISILMHTGLHGEWDTQNMLQAYFLREKWDSHKTWRNEPLGRPDTNGKILKFILNILWRYGHCIHLTQGRDQWRLLWMR
jgi:hypothetical protein